MRRRLAVIFVADMVDYSRLMEADQPGTIALIHELRDRWLEPEVSLRGGEVLKRLGDGWIIAFASVSDAIEAAMAVQTGLAGNERVQLRIAMHLGEIADDGEDLYGTGLNVASRLQAEAPPGGVMVSQDLYRQLDRRVAEGFGDAGSFRLKNIAEPVGAYQWRPAAPMIDKADVPVIGIETIQTAPDDPDALEAAADLQEQLVHLLSRRSGIRVLALGPGGDAEATYRLRCRLRNRSGRVRITATLILCADGQVTWSRVIEDETDDLLAVTDMAAAQLSDALRLQINAFDGDRLADLPDDQLSSSELRTRAAALYYRATVADYVHGESLLERALRLDPDNPTSLAMWCEAKLYLHEARHLAADPDLAARVAAAIDRAVQAAPRTDYNWFVRAHVRARLLGDIAGARKDIQRLERLNPGYVLGMEARGYVEFFAGEWTAAIAALSRSVRRSDDDPFLPFRLYPLAVAQMMVGDADAALATITEATELRPACRAYWQVRAWILESAGRAAEGAQARAAADRASDAPDILAPNLHLAPDIQRAIGLPG